jgi:hypothetical protein
MMVKMKGGGCYQQGVASFAVGVLARCEMGVCWAWIGKGA